MKNILVTPTFAPDFERCKAMLESCDRWVSGVDEHLLLVDKADLGLFKSLQRDRVRVLCKTDVLPVTLYQIPFYIHDQKRWWFTNCSAIPVRGWILQQIIKLAVAKQSSADAVIFADSDLVFVRALDLNELWFGKQLRLFRGIRGPDLYTSKRYQNWYNFGCNALDLGMSAHQTGAYITQLATMRPDCTIKLCEKLEQKFSKPWYQTLLSTWDFSEYILYGLFVEHLGENDCGHYFNDAELCHSSWLYDIASKDDVDDFVSKTAPQHRAIHLQSNLGLDSMVLTNALGV